MLATLQTALPQARLAVHHNATLQTHIADLVSFRQSSGARQVLSNPFNFAAFYMDRFLGLPASVPAGTRLIYLDTDVVLLGDVAQLQTINLNGHAVAAVEDCSQRLDVYVDIALLHKLGFWVQGINNKTCVFNRGIFVMDVVRWRKEGFTAEIELWMRRYNESKKDLYRSGMSQSPWLLTMHDRYQRLDLTWNCRGLGRQYAYFREVEALNEHGFNLTILNKLGVEILEKGWLQGHFVGYASATPFMSACSGKAQLLQYNGPLKPWNLETWHGEQGDKGPLCILPLSLKRAYGIPKMRITIKMTNKTRNVDFVRCWRIWTHYISKQVSAECNINKAFDPGNSVCGPCRVRELAPSGVEPWRSLQVCCEGAFCQRYPL